MKNCIAILFMITHSACIFAQQSATDNLKQSLIMAQTDREKTQLLTDIAGEYVYSIPDSTLKYGVMALGIAEENEWEKEQADILNILGQAYSGKGNLLIALTYTLKAVKIAEELKDDDFIAWCYANAGATYFYAEDYSKALDYFLKTRDYPEAFEKRKKIFLGFIGETYFNLGRYDSALYYTQQSLELVKNGTFHWPVPYLYMGKLSQQNGDTKEAIHFYKESIKSPGIPQTDSTKAYLEIARAFKQGNDYDSGLHYARKAYNLMQKSSLYLYSAQASALMAEFFRKKNQTDSAYIYQEIMVAFKDSLFNTEKLNQLQNLAFNEQLRKQEIEKEKEKLKGKIRMYALMAGLGIFLLIALILYRNNRQKQKANRVLETTLTHLKSTQSQLIQSEKMASLGELTAGIAHEIQNPLNFVNNFSEVSTELVEEMNEEIAKGNLEDAAAIASDLKQNLEKINQHGKRADAIVKGMLQHSRSSSGPKEPTDINALCDEYLRLSYHGLRAKDKSFNAKFETNFDNSIKKINLIPQDIGRAILNLINNAFYAVDEKKKSGIEGYEPIVIVSTKKINNKVEVRVADNGNGIPQKIVDKIFQPFFTTKPTGHGTGLGLSLSYDIVKAHGGELKVVTKEGEETEFIITLPAT